MSEMELRAHLRALSKMSPMPDDDVLEGAPEQIDQYASLLEAIQQEIGSHFDPVVVEALVGSFGVGDGFEVYWSTVHLIEKFRNVSTYAVLRKEAIDGPAGVRKWCCLMLGRRRDPEDLPILLSCLHDSEPRVVHEALRAIRMIAQVHRIPEAIPQVQGLVDNPNASLATAAQDALKALFA